jgi:hypothetical protein
MTINDIAQIHNFVTDKVLVGLARFAQKNIESLSLHKDVSPPLRFTSFIRVHLRSSTGQICLATLPNAKTQKQIWPQMNALEGG